MHQLLVVLDGLIMCYCAYQWWEWRKECKPYDEAKNGWLVALAGWSLVFLKNLL